MAAFRQKYPFVAVDVFRGGSSDVTTRATEEYSAKRYAVDVLEANTFVGPLKDNHVVRKFWSPELASYPDTSKDADGISVAVRESPRGFGFNTKAISKGQAPKTWADLLDPKWKGKMTLGGDETLTRYIGFWLETQGGESYIQKLAAQNPRVVHVSIRALADQVASGEVPLSPTINKAHVQAIQAKGGAIDWVAPDVVDSLVAQAALASQPPHPNAALLFLDFLLSKEGQQIYMKGNYDSARTDLSGGERSYKSFYVDNLPNMLERSQQWEKLADKYFNKPV